MREYLDIFISNRIIYKSDLSQLKKNKCYILICFYLLGDTVILSFHLFGTYAKSKRYLNCDKNILKSDIIDVYLKNKPEVFLYYVSDQFTDADWKRLYDLLKSSKRAQDKTMLCLKKENCLSDMLSYKELNTEQISEKLRILLTQIIQKIKK